MTEQTSVSFHRGDHKSRRLGSTEGPCPLREPSLVINESIQLLAVSVGSTEE